MAYEKIYSLIILCLLAAACQQQSVPGSPTDGQPSNIGKTVFYSADDEPLAFLPSVDSSAWTALRSLGERFDACSVPDDLLRRMTTDALVGSAVNYPLNYLIYVYNDPMSAVELIPENSYNTSCRLICKDYGLFKINVYGKYLGGRVAFGQLNVIAYPQQ